METEQIKTIFKGIFSQIQEKVGDALTDAQKTKLAEKLGIDFATQLAIYAGTEKFADVISNLIDNSTPSDLLAKTNAILDDPELKNVIKQQMGQGYDAINTTLLTISQNLTPSTANAAAAPAAATTPVTTAAPAGGICEPAAAPAGAPKAHHTTPAAGGGAANKPANQVNLPDALGSLTSAVINPIAGQDGFVTPEGSSNLFQSIGDTVKGLLGGAGEAVNNSGPMGRLAFGAALIFGLGSWMFSKNGSFGNFLGTMMIGLVASVVIGMLGIGNQQALAEQHGNGGRDDDRDYDRGHGHGNRFGYNAEPAFAANNVPPQHERSALDRFNKR